MKKIKVVIFDNDGMITDGGRFSTTYVNDKGIDMEIMNPFFDDAFKKCLTGKADLKEELEKVLIDWKWDGTVKELMDYWFSIGDKLNEEVYQSILKLKQEGAIVCLATNQEKYRTEYLTNKYSYNEIFNEIFPSYKLGVQKHSDEGLRLTSDVLKEKYSVTDNSEIMYWDDRETVVENLIKNGFRGELYRGFASYVKRLNEEGYLL